jgi:uncharacterized membrane protein YbhN (UPF0104 family)
MRTLREHPVKLTCVAFALAAAVVVVIAGAYGFDAFADAWRNPSPAWILLVVGGELLAIPAYAIAYRIVAKVNAGPELSWSLTLRAVVAGFGAFAPGGGFALDKKLLHAVHNDERGATVRVLGLGALEWALLAPAAWISAVVLLVEGDSNVMPSLLWPWAIAVPIGFGIGLWVAAPSQRERFAGNEDHGRIRAAFSRSLRGVGILHSLVRDPQCFLAVVGAALYWAFEIAAFYGAIRFIGLQPNLGETILAYATGYALTRRSMPLGGAGATEALMTFSLHWVGQPVPAALAAVVVYRVFNFVLPTVPALIVRPKIKPLLDAADGRRRQPILGSG